MKLNKIALAVLAAAVAPVAAQAGVTVTPLVGAHITNMADDEQREVLRTGKQLNNNYVNQSHVTNPKNGGVAKESSLYAGAAVGIELTPSTQFQVEYGVSNANGEASEYSAKKGENRFDVEQEMITGNFLVGLEQITGYNADNKFKPYALIGAGRSKIEVEAQEQYVADDSNAQGIKAGQTVKAGQQVAQSKDTIGNVGLGARYLINDALALRGEARGIYNFDNSWWEALALAGLEVTLGGRLAPAVAAPALVEPTVIADTTADADQDGVPDHLDACPGTPVNVVVDERGCPVDVDVREDLRLELRVFFDYDKSAVKPQYREEIAKVAEKMREFPNATAQIEGHASKDSARSNARYNQRLSEARANAIKAVLSNEFGIAPNRLSAVGYGFDRPIAPNTTDEGKAMNRRVEAVISGSKVTTVPQTKDMQVQ
ncbi:OmpA family protein [Moraxella sp. FZLJ2107]|uniref:OmpA family protein n=1 Tax=unclassified Moraxella TaxID=2685852 RepID=UPI00209C4A22|nr:MULTISPECIES: OmpA family protein [unclassified Moraxella]USZ15684.1 OmpA family protein [Moraxella sp. FZFQ2102]UTO04522.1 OmpA family protein [Moraxella sp. FZLJ2107]UTO23355.1 OmpA family protein [Moraxella sp. FZLJ2109]